MATVIDLNNISNATDKNELYELMNYKNDV